MEETNLPPRADLLAELKAVRAELEALKRQALRPSEADERFRAIFNSQYTFVGVLDPDGTLLDVNERALAAGGLAREEVVGLPFWECYWWTIHPKTQARLRDAVARAARGEFIQYEVEVLIEGGTILIDFTLKPVWGASGDIILLIPEGRDITEQKRRVQELRESTALLRQAEELARIGSWEWNITTGRLSWSGQMYHLFGIEPEAFTGELSEVIMNTIHPDDRDRVEAANRRVLEEKRPVPTEYRVIWPDGSVRNIYAQGILIEDERGQSKLVGVVQDITDRKRTEEQINTLNKRLTRRAAELEAANRELKDFSYTVSHDLRAPLRAITGFAELIRFRYADRFDEEGQRYFENIVKASTRMDRLISDLLQYSRLGREEVTRTPVALKDILGAVLSNLSSAIVEKEAVVELPESLPRVMATATLLESVLTNLIDNAIKYHQPGKPPHIRIEVAEEGEQVRLRVQDNGIGIPMEHQESVFRVFNRLHGTEAYPGTGIGLAIVQKAAQLMGGTILLESTPGEGSTFIVCLVPA